MMFTAVTCSAQCLKQTVGLLQWPTVGLQTMANRGLLSARHAKTFETREGSLETRSEVSKTHDNIPSD